MATLKDKDKAEGQGRRAAKAGKPWTACPYPEAPAGTQTASNMCRRIWLIGWMRENKMRVGEW